MKHLIGILKSSVAVEDWMSIRIQTDCFIKCGKHQLVVIAIAKSQGKYKGRQPIPIDWVKFGQL